MVFYVNRNAINQTKLKFKTFYKFCKHTHNFKNVNDLD